MPSDQLIEMTQVLTADGSESPSLEDFRSGYDDFGKVFPAESGVNYDELTLAGVDGHRISVPGAADDRAILYLHGGGYARGSLESHRMIVARLAKLASMPIYFPDYRLAPEHRFPAASQDCFDVYKALLSSIPANRIAVVGDSAGGGLVCATLIRARDEGLELPACAWAICPWVDMEGHGSWRSAPAQGDPLLRAAELVYFVDTYLEVSELRHPWVAPIHADLSGLPMMLIEAGSVEILADDARNLSARLQQCGSPHELHLIEGAPHVWHHMLPEVPEAIRSMQLGADFIVRHCGD